MTSTDATTIRRLRLERDHALEMTDRLRDHALKLAAALKGADAEIARLRARQIAPRWWCMACDHLNAAPDACAICGDRKPSFVVRHA